MSGYPLVYRNLLYPVFDRAIKGRRTIQYLKQAEESQWWEPSQLLSKQLEDLRSIVAYAFQHCAYYRRLWNENGLNPDTLQSIEEFGRYPVLSRDDVRNNRSELRSSVVSNRLTKSTGGSTGEPLVFELCQESNQRRTAMMFRGYDWAKAGLGTRRLLIWGVDLKKRSLLRRWKVALHHRFDNEMVINCFDLSPSTMRAHFHSMQNFRPHAIVAYTNALYEFANFLDANSLVPSGIQSIVVGAEKLYPFQRQRIESLFQAPVFETYGSREFMLIGAECERHSGLHLSMENLYVEIVDDNGKPTPEGIEGNVVVTDLFNRAMPFIRYQNGDRAIAGFQTCPCGRGLPLLRKVVGRQLDVIRTPSGKVIPGEFFPHCFKDYPAIRRFQVRQDRIDQVEIRLVVDSELNASVRLEIEQKVRSTLGCDSLLQIFEVDEIPLTKSGKLQVVVSQLSTNHRQS